MDRSLYIQPISVRDFHRPACACADVASRRFFVCSGGWNGQLCEFRGRPHSTHCFQRNYLLRSNNHFVGCSRRADYYLRLVRSTLIQPNFKSLTVLCVVCRFHLLGGTIRGSLTSTASGVTSTLGPLSLSGSFVLNTTALAANTVKV